MKYVATLITLTVLGANLTGVHGSDCNTDNCKPEQIHIAFGEKIKDIVVTWTTIDDTQESLVQFGLQPQLEWEAEGIRTKYKHLRGQWIHRVTLLNLRLNTTYHYRCGSRSIWSEKLHFTTAPKQNTVLRAAIYGDMGAENAKAIPYLQEEVESQSVNFVLHVGDFAYDMHDNDSRTGDEFMRKIQSFAAFVPYMVCPGNHEYNKNFTQYKSRMTMPKHQKWESMFYSWNIGLVHFVSINTEAYYFLNFGKDPLINQFRWLVKDLNLANSKKNRKKRPWIIMYGHRPMYCSGGSKIDRAQCTNEKTRTGVDLPEYKENFGIEPLLINYGVDIVIWAHEHLYERAWPIYDYKVYNGSTEHPYTNPRAPVHIITGAGGCKDENNSAMLPQPDWCAFRSKDYSYTRLNVYNKTHVYLEQISVDFNGNVIDSFWVVQTRHRPFRLKQQKKK